MSKINDRIKEIRTDFNLTQSEFAKELHLSREYISKIENGKYDPSSATISLISYKYGINSFWIENGSGEKYIPQNQIDKYKYVLNNEILSEWLETPETKDHLQFYEILDIIVQLMNYKDVQKNSHLFYDDKIKSILQILLSYIKISSMKEIDETTKETWLNDTGNKIKMLLNSALSALNKCNLDDEININK